MPELSLSDRRNDFMNDKLTVKIERDAQGTLTLTGEHGQVQVISAYSRVTTQPVPYDTTNLTINPYLGLAAFQETEANRFFGREQVTRKLWEKLALLYQATQQGKTALRFLPVIAPSGTGKSSLLRAGLLPEVARRGLPATQNLRVAAFSPGTNPIQNLSVMMARLATQEMTPFAKARIYAKELTERDGLRHIAKELPALSPLLLVVDQFEELYTLCSDPFERALFIDNLLLAAADKIANITVVIALRTEFLIETQTHPTLYQTVSKQAVMIPMMSTAELRDCIVKPAQLAEITWENSTVQHLIEQVKGQKYALSQLQLALTYLWEMHQQGRTEARVLKTINNLSDIVEFTAQRLYLNLAESERKIAQQFFLKLIQLNNQLCHGQCSGKMLDLTLQADDKLKEILRYYADHDSHLITISNIPQFIVTLTHEVLLHHWSTLQHWLLEHREEQLLKQRVSHAAYHWESLNRPTRLLWHSGDLVQLEQLYLKSRSELTELQTLFFKTSLRRHRHLKYRNYVLALCCIGVGIAGAIMMWQAI